MAELYIIGERIDARRVQTEVGEEPTTRLDKAIYRQLSRRGAMGTHSPYPTHPLIKNYIGSYVQVRVTLVKCGHGEPGFTNYLSGGMSHGILGRKSTGEVTPLGDNTLDSFSLFFSFFT